MIKMTRQERGVLKEARGYGLSAFGYEDDPITNRKVTQTLALLTDTQRAVFFIQIEDFCALSESLRGEN